jgi:predicted secreted protein
MMNANVWPKGFHLTSPRGEAATHQWDIELSEAKESPTHHQQQHSVHSADGEGTVGGTPAIAKWPIFIDARA